MKISGIYQIQSKCKPERIYIGSTININNRWKDHFKELRRNKHHSSKLQNHFNKYGESDLQFSVLLGCDKSDLLKIEQYFIDSYNPFFNICKIAGNSLGTHRKLSKETRDRMSFARMGEKNPMYGKKRSEEVILKIKKAKTGKPVLKLQGIKRPDTTIRNIGNKYGEKNKGRIFTEEHKKNISKAKMGSIAWNKDKKMTQEYCDTISRIKKGNKNCVGRVLSDETRRKISESQKRRNNKIA
jgi:group I intron endonuclease